MEKNQLTSTELVAIRKERNLTQTELAAFLGVQLRSIQRWEKGAAIDGRTTLAYIWIRDASPKIWDRFLAETAKTTTPAP